MTTLQVHLVMLALGLLAFWLLAGYFSKPKSRSSRLRRQWWLGALAAVAVSASPLSRIWRPTDTGIQLLTQSLLIAAIFLLALLLVVLLVGSLKGLRNRSKQTPLMINGHTTGTNAPTTQAGSSPILINADGPAATSSTQAASLVSTAADDTATIANGATIDKSRDVTRDEQDNVQASDQHSDQQQTDTVKLPPDQKNITQRHVKDIESVVPMHNKHDATQTLDESISGTTAANDNESIEELTLEDNPFDNPISDTLAVEEELDLPTIPNDTQRLDLSETEQLFAEIRSQQTEVQLPDDEELRQANETTLGTELDLETELASDDGLVVQDETSIQHNTDHNSAALEAEIEEAEVVDVDEADLEFGNDLTGEYAHPSVHSSDTIQLTDSNLSPDSNSGFMSSSSVEETKVPETLDEALIEAKITAISLQTQVDNLESSILELDKLRDSTISAAEQNKAEQQQLLKDREALLESEDQARRAAESVIAAQSALIDRSKRQQAIATTLLTKERKRLNALQQEIARSRKMARTAANLARRAAVAQQESRVVAKREQNARIKSQESTRKAVNIARNAISALAAEERKRGITRH